MPVRRTKVGVIRPDGKPAPKTVRDLRDFDIDDLDEVMHVKDEPPLKRRKPKRGD